MNLALLQSEQSPSMTICHFPYLQQPVLNSSLSNFNQEKRVMMPSLQLACQGEFEKSF